MDALDVPDGTLSGVASWYSVIHTPPAQLPPYFAEFHRVLAPGGHLLLAFFESEGPPVTPFDHKVTTAYRWPVDGLAELAAKSGFTETGRMLREPREGERFRRGHLLMKRSAWSMPAYVIVTIDVLDEEAALAYAPVAQQSILAHGGRYLVAGPTPEPVEGTWESSRLVLLEFPDVARIGEWYDSPEYRHAREIREGKVRVSLLFAEGAPPEGFSLPVN